MKKVKTVKKFNPPPMVKKALNTPIEKKTSDLKFGIELKDIQGKINFESNFIITIAGDKSSIKSGLIRAMLADETFAKHITLAAEYYKTI